MCYASRAWYLVFDGEAKVGERDRTSPISSGGVEVEVGKGVVRWGGGVLLCRTGLGRGQAIVGKNGDETEKELAYD